MKITRKTKIILFDTNDESYKPGTIASRSAGQTPVCTQRHFIDELCKLFERVTPNMQENPMYQDINWQKIESETPGRIAV